MWEAALGRRRYVVHRKRRATPGRRGGRTCKREEPRPTAGREERKGGGKAPPSRKGCTVGSRKPRQATGEATQPAELTGVQR